MKRFYCVLPAVCLFVNSIAQVLPIHIGDRLPALAINNIVNTKQQNFKTNDNRKLLILDFMATTCVSCIRALPRLDSLQAKYRNNLQLLIVTPEKAAKVQGFLKKHPYKNLAFVTRDTMLKQRFPHEYVSHLVWIDSTQTVRAITHSEYVTAANINSVLAGERIRWPVKKDAAGFDFTKPLLGMHEELTTAPEAAAAQYTAILPYLPGVQKYFKISRDSNSSIQYAKLINYSLLDMYKLLHGKPKLQPAFILFDNMDPGKFLYDSAQGFFDEWKATHAYAMEAAVPADLTAEAVKQHLIDALNFHFKLRVRMEKRVTECWVLRQTKPPDSLKVAGDKGMRISQLIFLVNNRAGEMPVINDMNEAENMLLPLLPTEAVIGVMLTEILKQHGLEMVKERVELEMMVVEPGL